MGCDKGQEAVVKPDPGLNHVIPGQHNQNNGSHRSNGPSILLVGIHEWRQFTVVQSVYRGGMGKHKMSYGSDKDGGFNAASKAYKSEPTLQNYVHLRRSNPMAEIEVAVLGGFDSVRAMQPELEAYGIPVEQMMAVLDADQAAVSAESLRLLEELIRHQELAKIGETQVVRREQTIPLKLVDWIIAVALEALSWTNSMEMNRDLIVLINARLAGTEPSYRQLLKAREARILAIWTGAQLLAAGQKSSIRKVAIILGVSPSAVSRWFATGEFDRESEKASKHFKEDGSLSNLLEAFSQIDIGDPD
ncbi:MAG: hypothetical protein AAF668_06620 [Pseudomonadota bacterium]